MKLKSCMLLLLALMLAACQTIKDNRVPLSATVGAIGLASDTMLNPEYMAGALVAYALYDPAAPNWEVNVTPLAADRMQIDLEFRALVSGGEGEARQVFMRSAERLATEGGFAGFRVERYEEGVQSRRPFARRYARGRILLASEKAAL